MLVVGHWVVGVCCEDKVCWDDLCALVKKLVERVLSVGSWFPKEDWTSGVLDEVVGGARDRLSIGLHGELLEISWEAV